MNKLREKLNSGKVLIGAQSFLGSKEILEILGSMDYDFVFICAEHTSYGTDKLYDLVHACQNAGTPALVRLPEYDLTYTKKTLDMGTQAVLFPMVKSPEEAKKCMDICLYPPYGKRGFGPMSAVRWGLDSEAEFVKHNNDDLVRMIQIEHIDAVNSLEEIVKNKYIDAYIFGPNDLASSIGHINDIYNPEVIDTIKRAIKVLDKAGCRYGVSLGSIDLEKIAFWRSLGMSIFSLGADFAYVRDGALKAKKDLDNLLIK